MSEGDLPLADEIAAQFEASEHQAPEQPQQPEPPEHAGVVLKRYLDERGLTPQQFARLCYGNLNDGSPRNTSVIYSALNGQRNITAVTADAWERALKLPAGTFAVYIHTGRPRSPAEATARKMRVAAKPPPPAAPTPAAPSPAARPFIPAPPIPERSRAWFIESLGAGSPTFNIRLVDPSDGLVGRLCRLLIQEGVLISPPPTTPGGGPQH